MTTSKPHEQLPGDRANALASLIDIAEGAIVSRVLARTGGGSLTLFAFDGGQGLSEHTAPFEALVQVLDGGLLLTIGGVEVAVGPGEIARMPAGVPHALRAATPSRMLAARAPSRTPGAQAASRVPAARQPRRARAASATVGSTVPTDAAAWTGAPIVHDACGWPRAASGCAGGRIELPGRGC